MVSAVSGKPKVAKPSFIARARNFLTEVWIELKKARWPSREELIRFTAVVIVAVVAVAFYIAIIDWIMTVVNQQLHMFPKKV